MPFVKLDCEILKSSLWYERLQRELFITSLLMARPHELLEETAQLAVDCLDPTGWMVPPGWYGFVAAAGSGIIRTAGIDGSGRSRALAALRALGEPDPDSRSKEFEGRRLVRVNGGYIVLNYNTYRERDYSAAERMKRYRRRLKDREEKLHRNVTLRTRHVTQAEAEAEVQKTTTPLPLLRSAQSVSVKKESPSPEFHTFWEAYPRKEAMKDAWRAWLKAKPDLNVIMAALKKAKNLPQWNRGKQYIPLPATWINGERWDDDL